MDKSRDDVRRGGGAGRFSLRQIYNNNNIKKKLVSGPDFGDDLVVPLEKPKKQRLVKKLSAVNRASSSTITTNNDDDDEDNIEMGCNMSDRETDNNGSNAKKFKPPKKFVDDSNGVDHASVPRRLRSAMKKRGRESLSPPLQDSKKLNHTNSLRVESPSKKDGLKKSKLSMKQGSSDWSTKHVAGPITKDEEEVVETLYALAGMFPDNDSNDKSKLETTSSEAKLPALPDSMESPTPAIEVAKKDARSTGPPLRTSESTNPLSNVDNSVKETAGVDSWNEPRVEEQPDLNECKNLHGESESCVPQVNVHSMILSLSETEHIADKPSCNPVMSHPLPELNQESLLKQASKKDTSLLDKKSKLLLGATTTGSQLVQDMVMEPRNKGEGVWPGLSPMVLHDVGSHGSLQSSAAKVPAWLDATLSASKPSPLENGFSIGKVTDGASTRRSLKRSAAHVHICHLIQNSKTVESKDTSPVQPDPLRTTHEEHKLLAVNDFDRVKNSFNGVIKSGNNIGSSTSGRNLSEVRKSILQHNRLLEEQQQNAAATRANTLQKQSFDFLSLSAGGGGAEATNSSNRNGNLGIAPSSQFQVPYLHSFPQQKFMTLQMPQTRYPSSAYPDQGSTSTSASSQQVQLQLPPYLVPTRKSPPFATEQQQQQQQHQQQQQLWAAHLAAQYRPASTAVNPLPGWVNGRYDTTLLDLKYGPVSQQQHHHQHQQQPQLVTLGSSFPPTRVKRQEVEGGFRSSSAFPLQLLCNERL